MMENFVVSARKFRPMTFASVVGQKHITQTLKNAISRGQLAHAYLFTGPRGVGKTSCARIFAKAINCLNPTPDHEACGECESCVAFAKDRSFNIHELDAASNNSVDDMRALTDKVRIAPQIGKYSIYIIDEVHMLSTAAFNAFLKTLEEPPHYAIFILATTEKHKILPTILSRCQVYDFNRIRVEDMVEYLKYIAAQQGVTYDEESLHIIAQKADGGMRDALSTFDRVVSFCGNQLNAQMVAESIGSLDFNTYFKATELALNENFSELLLLLDAILKKGFDAQIFIAGMCEHLRNLLIAKNPQTSSLLETTAALGAQYANQASIADYDFLFNAINLLTQADTTYKASTNRRLHAELALIKLCALKKKEPIAERYPMPAITAGGWQNEVADYQQLKSSEAQKSNLTQGGVTQQQSVNQAANSVNGSIPHQHLGSKSENSESSGVSQQPTSVVTPDNGVTQNYSEAQSFDPANADQAPLQQFQQHATRQAVDTLHNSQSSAGQQMVDPSQNQTQVDGTGQNIQPQNRVNNTLQDTQPQASPQTTSTPYNTESQQQTQQQRVVSSLQNSQSQRRSITGISLNPAKQVEKNAQSEDAPVVPTHSPEEAERVIKQNYGRLIELWNGKNRPRIASALEVCRINGNQITVAVPDEVQQDELNQAKWEIEKDIFDLTEGVRSNLCVVVKFVEQAYRPITIEQKYQYLADINPDILKLHKRLDLTI